VAPRGSVFLGNAENLVGLAAYLFTCGLIVAIGEAMRAAQARADERGELMRVTLASATRADIRERILVSDTGSQLFTGQLRTELDPSGRCTDDELMAAMRTASAEDVLVALPDGLDSEVEEKGRSFSGGQRQRLVLVRALLADPSVLVLVEPTSAVDAHTEARIADRLHEHRSGRSTVVLTASPLLLDRVDEVIFVAAGRVVATGKHRELLETTPQYRRTVTRETEAEAEEALR